MAPYSDGSDRPGSASWGGGSDVDGQAWDRIESARAARFYFDLRRERKAQAGGESAFTPAISNVVALRAGLAAVEAMGGVDALVRNAATLAASTRKAAEALGLSRSAFYRRLQQYGL